jgi:hypothetical protein
MQFSCQSGAVLFGAAGKTRRKLSVGLFEQRVRGDSGEFGSGPYGKAVGRTGEHKRRVDVSPGEKQYVTRCRSCTG